MSNPQPAAFTDEQKSVIKQLGRLRAFGFLFGVSAIVFAAVIQMESDNLSHAFDDVSIVAVSIIALAIILARRKSLSLPRLKQANNILVILGVLYLAFTIAGLVIEANDPMDVGDDFQDLHSTRDARQPLHLAG